MAATVPSHIESSTIKLPAPTLTPPPNSATVLPWNLDRRIVVALLLTWITEAPPVTVLPVCQDKAVKNVHRPASGCVSVTRSQGPATDHTDAHQVSPEKVEPVMASVAFNTANVDRLPMLRFVKEDWDTVSCEGENLGLKCELAACASP